MNLALVTYEELFKINNLSLLRCSLPKHDKIQKELSENVLSRLQMARATEHGAEKENTFLAFLPVKFCFRSQMS